jgi:HTH-type transcriptional regulator/antitoxin HigA
MVVRIIKTKAQHKAALAEIARLTRLDPARESREGLRLELLAKLVQDYEAVKFVFAKPDPIDAILFRMEERGLRQKDVARVLGGKNRASEVLSRKRPLTLSMIRALHEKLDIPPALLIREAPAEYQVLRKRDARAAQGAKTKSG